MRLSFTVADAPRAVDLWGVRAAVGQQARCPALEQPRRLGLLANAVQLAQLSSLLRVCRGC